MTISIENMLTQQAGRSGNATTIVLLDKHPGIRKMMTAALQCAGYRSLICLDDIPALIHLAQTTLALRTPSLILVDLSRPEIPVETVLETLHAYWRSREMRPPAIIILTTHPLLQQTALAAGYPAFLKPFHLHGLFSAIHTSLCSYGGERREQGRDQTAIRT